MKRICFSVVAMVGAMAMTAQTFGVSYTGELQTDFNNQYNMVNQLHLSYEQKLGDRFTATLLTISTAKTHDTLLNDMQGFSNIESDNLPLALAVAGLSWSINERHSLFAGVRRVDEDYFTSDVTSLFTNSSCGIFPTLSANYPVATYPMAAMGVHYTYHGKSLVLNASLYNGTAYNRFSGRGNVFRVCPSSDGVFAMAQGEYKTCSGSYFLGAAMHHGEPSEGSVRKPRATLWAYGEQAVSGTVRLIAGYSHALSSDSPCTDFAGVGAMWSSGRVQVGAFSDVARFDECTEWATELTCKYQFTNHMYVQPAIHLITATKVAAQPTDNFTQVAALLRLGIEL